MIDSAPASMQTQPGCCERGGTRPLIAMVQVTNRCNLSCPLCFSGATDHAADVPLDRIHQRLQNLLRVTGGPIPLQISGGEPTVRKNLGEVIALARQLGFIHIELIINGIRIAREPHLLNEWKTQGLKAIYLQFDGLEAATHIALRGRGCAISAFRLSKSNRAYRPQPCTANRSVIRHATPSVMCLPSTGSAGRCLPT